MEIVIKTFDELSIKELHEIYKVRVSVFVVEQNCAYQEVDDCDKDAYHVYFRDEEGIQAYLRVIPKGKKLKEVSIGRVISLKRREGLGTRLLKVGIQVARHQLNATCIEIEAQSYARNFYENVGFKQNGDEFIEDGISHIPMILK